MQKQKTEQESCKSRTAKYEQITTQQVAQRLTTPTTYFLFESGFIELYKQGMYETGTTQFTFYILSAMLKVEPSFRVQNDSKIHLV